MTRWKLALTIGIVSALITLLLLLPGQPDSTPEESSPAEPNVVELGLAAQRSVDLEVSEVRERTIQTVVRTTGIVSPDQNRIAHIRPLARGIIDKVYVQLGDHVRKNQSLLRYDNIELGEFIGDYLNLLAELERVKAQREVAHKFLARAEALIAVEGIAQREYELRQAEYEQAVAAVGSQRAELAQVEEKLHRFGLGDEDIKALGGPERTIHRTASHNIVRAPFRGVITTYDASPGELVDQERELFTLVDTTTVWVLADLYEKDIGLVGTGGEARIQVPSYPGEVFTGKITYVSDFLDPASRTAKVRCVVPNPEGRLKLEMFATVEIPAAHGQKALAVPRTALQQVNGATVVFVQNDQTHFEKRVVQVGKQDEEWAEILNGLRDGEKVVSVGSFSLKSTMLREMIGGGE